MVTVTSGLVSVAVVGAVVTCTPTQAKRLTSEPITFVGNLKTTDNVAIAGKTVTIKSEAGVARAAGTTDSAGNYSATITGGEPSAGVYKYYAEFSAVYLQARSSLVGVSVGLEGIPPTTILLVVGAIACVAIGAYVVFGKKK